MRVPFGRLLARHPAARALAPQDGIDQRLRVPLQQEHADRGRDASLHEHGGGIRGCVDSELLVQPVRVEHGEDGCAPREQCRGILDEGRHLPRDAAARLHVDQFALKPARLDSHAIPDARAEQAVRPEVGAEPVHLLVLVEDETVAHDPAPVGNTWRS